VWPPCALAVHGAAGLVATKRRWRWVAIGPASRDREGHLRGEVRWSSTRLTRSDESGQVNPDAKTSALSGAVAPVVRVGAMQRVLAAAFDDLGRTVRGSEQWGSNTE
jgi:hypothetical protein